MSQPPTDPQQPAPQWQPTNPPAPAPPEEKKSWFARHKVLTTILALVLFFAVAQAFTGGDGDTKATDAPTTPAAAADATSEEPAGDDATEETADQEDATEEETTEEAPAADQPGIGDAVRDGKFEFVVTGVEDGGTEVGNEFLNEKAQGRFYLIHVSVTNIGDKPQMMSDSNQKVKDDQGRTFEPSSMAGMYLDGNDLWLKDINPGNTLKGTLVFDMPEGATPVEIELHDSMFSDGVTVTLK